MEEWILRDIDKMIAMNYTLARLGLSGYKHLTGATTGRPPNCS